MPKVSELFQRPALAVRLRFLWESAHKPALAPPRRRERRETLGKTRRAKRLRLRGEKMDFFSALLASTRDEARPILEQTADSLC